MGKFLLFTAVLLLNVHFDVNAVDFQIVSEGKKHGLVDEDGKLVIPIIYDRLGWSDGERQLVDDVIGYFEENKWGIINTKNEKITEPEYVNLYPGKFETLIASRKNDYSGTDQYGVLDSKGKAKLGFQYHSLAMGGDYLIASQLKSGIVKWGILDYAEQQIIPIEFGKIQVLNLNFVVYQDNNAGIFSMEGLQLTPFVYDKVSELGSYLVLHNKIGKMGLASMTGAILDEPQYKSIKMDSTRTLIKTPFPKWELIVPGGGVVKEFYYDNISPISHGIYHVTANGRQALINIEEEYLLAGDDWTISVPDEKFVIAQKGRKFGVLKEGGIEVIPIEFDSLYYSGRHFYTLKNEDQPDQWQIHSSFGNLISSSSFDAVYPMSEELIATKKNGYWGYIDFSGHTVIEYKFDYAWPFKEGRAKVNYLGNQGVINTAGNWVIHPNHSEVTIVNKDLFINHTGKRYDLLDGLERVIYQTYNDLEPHSFGLLEITGTGKYGLLDTRGNSRIPPKFDYISELSGDRVYILQRDQEYTVLEKNGGSILTETSDYDSIGSLSEGFLSVLKDRRFGFIDLNGQLRIANRYDAVEDFKEGMAAIQLVGRWGFVDRLERLRVQPLYDKVENFERGVSVVKKDGFFGIIDIQGNEILPITFDSIVRKQNTSFIVMKNDLYGLANLKGELVISPKYELLEETHDLIIVKQRGKYGVIRKNGINVIPSTYDLIKYDAINGYYLAAKFEQ